MERINWKLKTPGRKSSLNLWISVPYCVAVGTDLFTRNNSKETPAHTHQMPKCLFSEFSACCFILNPKKGKIWDRNLLYVASRRDITIIKSLLSRNLLLLYPFCTWRLCMALQHFIPRPAGTEKKLSGRTERTHYTKIIAKKLQNIWIWWASQLFVKVKGSFCLKQFPKEIC